VEAAKSIPGTIAVDNRSQVPKRKPKGRQYRSGLSEEDFKAVNITLEKLVRYVFDRYSHISQPSDRFPSPAGTPAKRLFQRSRPGQRGICTGVRKHLTHRYQCPVAKLLSSRYYKIIKKPIDLSSIKHKLLDGQYQDRHQFKDDLDLIVANCKIYNGEGSLIFNAAVEFEKVFTDREKPYSVRTRAFEPD
jgi:hypothetical protein